jgi:isopentenyl-diphosphate delta-isomerase
MCTKTTRAGARVTTSPLAISAADGAAGSEEVERVVLLDDDGRAVGSMPKAAVHSSETPLHLAFSCYAFDRHRRLLMTRRADTKATWPGVWTNTCCGHPAPGEPLPAAVARRLHQELGLTPLVLVPVLPRFRYRAVMENGIVENEICPVFVAVVGEVPRPDPAEVSEIRWVDWQEFGELAAERSPFGNTISPWAREQVAELALLGAGPDDWPADPDRDRLTRLFDV